MDFENIRLATKSGRVTLLGVLEDKYPLSRGNCFSLFVDADEYAILNFYYENIKKLLDDGIIKFPISILPLSNSHAVIADHRIPNEWYNERFCSTCTPFDLLPVPQRLQQVLDIKRGKRKETIIINPASGERLISVTV